MNPRAGKKLEFIWKVAKGAFYFACIGNTLVNLTGSPANVDGLSMKPALLHTDWVWVNFWALRGGSTPQQSLKRGDVVVFISHRDPDKFIVKRIIGLEGDIIKNDKSNHNDCLVPKGHCWVEGDNYQVSEDSIKYGPISTGLILAKITHTLGFHSTFPFIAKRLVPYHFPTVTSGGTIVIESSAY